jgi:hypothetical protein
MRAVRVHQYGMTDELLCDSRFPLEAAAEACRHLESRARGGKILLALCDAPDRSPA